MRDLIFLPQTSIGPIVNKILKFPDSLEKKKQRGFRIVYGSWPPEEHREPNLYALTAATYPCICSILPLHRCNRIHKSKTITPAQVTSQLEFSACTKQRMLHPKTSPGPFLWALLPPQRPEPSLPGTRTYQASRKAILAFFEVDTMLWFSTGHHLVTNSPPELNPEGFCLAPYSGGQGPTAMRRSADTVTLLVQPVGCKQIKEIISFH